jgi:hypothetical protein
MKKERSGSVSQRHGSADPDPHKNVMDPHHCSQVSEWPPASDCPYPTATACKCVHRITA